jgi:L-amino acid N-acyltransferase YncA
VSIRPVELKDADRIAKIYGYYVRETPATFEIEVPSPDIVRDRIQAFTRSYPWLIHETEDELDGYAFAARYKERESYRYAVELSLYVDQAKAGHGIGTELFNELISACRDTDAAVLIAAVALPNEPSLRLLDKFGFSEIAVFEKVGYKFNRWIDVGYWKLEIKDRSIYFPGKP